MAEAAGTLLLVDDDEAKRYLLGTWLRRAGHTVTEAETGRDALGLLDGIELVASAADGNASVPSVAAPSDAAPAPRKRRRFKYTSLGVTSE